MDKKYISPFVVISLEGISGLIIVSVLIPIMSMVQCNSSFFICKGTFSESFKIIFENMFESIGKASGYAAINITLYASFATVAVSLLFAVICILRFKHRFK